MTLEAFEPVNTSICTKSFIYFSRTINTYPTMMFTIVAIVTTGAFWKTENNIMNLTATKIKTNNTNWSSFYKNNAVRSIECTITLLCWREGIHSLAVLLLNAGFWAFIQLQVVKSSGVYHGLNRPSILIMFEKRMEQ